MIEVILVIGIVSVLLAITLPAFSSARDRAESAITISQLRTHAQVFSMYAGDWRDAWPVFINPTIDPTWVRSGRFGAELFYFDSCFSWNLALAESYYSEDPVSSIFFPPNYEDPVVARYNFFTPLLYSCSLIADPAYWRYETRLEGLSQWNGTRIDQARYPASKCLLVDSWRHPDWIGNERQSESVRMSLIDGSATELRSGEVLKGYSRGDGVAHGGHPSGPPRGLHTIDGVRGRDIVR